MAARDPISPVQVSVHLRKVVPDRNCHRFYSLLVEHDLFGNACLVRHYGRIGTSGHEMMQPHETTEAAASELHSLMARKIRKGYTRL